MLKPEGGSLVPERQYFMRYCDHNQRYELFTDEQRQKIVKEYYTTGWEDEHITDNNGDILNIFSFRKINMVNLDGGPMATHWLTSDGYYIPYDELPACSC